MILSLSRLFTRSSVVLLCVYLSVLLVGGAAAYAEEVTRIAVITLRNTTQLEKAEIDYLTNQVRQVATKRLPKSYLVMTQENIIALLPPNTKIEDCVGECEVDTGRAIGARYIITGEVLRFGSSLRVTLRLHETETGRLVGSETARGKVVEDLESPTEEAIAALVANLVSADAPAAVTPPTPVSASPQAVSPSSRSEGPRPKAAPKSDPPAVQSSALHPYRWTVVLGGGWQECAPNGDADCSAFQGQMTSSSRFGDLGLYLMLGSAGGLRFGLNASVAHAKFDSESNAQLAINDVSVGGYLRYQLGALFLQGQLGGGVQRLDGEGVVGGNGYDSETSLVIYYSEPSLRVGLDGGVSFGRFDLSVYYLRFAPLGETTVCVTVGLSEEACDVRWMPGVGQLGVRFGVSFGGI